MMGRVHSRAAAVGWRQERSQARRTWCFPPPTHPHTRAAEGSADVERWPPWPTQPPCAFLLTCRPLPARPPPPNTLQDCNAAEGSTDYETWTVPRPDTCLLGERYSMVRRKRDAACFNTGSYTPAVAQQGTCNCTFADTGAKRASDWVAKATRAFADFPSTCGAAAHPSGSCIPERTPSLPTSCLPRPPTCLLLQSVSLAGSATAPRAPRCQTTPAWTPAR